MPTLSVDLGGTKMRAALLDDEGRITHREVRPTPRDAERPDALLALMADVAALGSPRLAVVGVPGRVDHGRGVMDHAPNLPPSWKPYLTESALSLAIGVPVWLANDADLAAAGEGVFGGGRGFDDVVYVTFSTGVGGGVLLRRKLVVGRRSVVEVGHHVIDQQAFLRGEPCTLEQLASGTTFARYAMELGLDVRTVAKLAEEGDPAARSVLDRVGTAAAIGVRNLAFFFTPEVVVIGGGLGLSGPWILDAIRAHLAAHGPPAWSCEVKVAELGDDAGLVGAAAWELVQP